MINLEALENSQISGYVIKLYDFIRIQYSKRTGRSVLDDKDIAIHTRIDQKQINLLKKEEHYDTKHKDAKNRRIGKIYDVMYAFKVKAEIDEEDFKFSFFKPEEDDYLKELATKLACNLVDVSTSFDKKNSPHKEIINNDSLEKFRKTNQSERFILITGAGVSHAATKGAMPLADEAIKVIKKKVLESGISESILEEELENLTLSTNLKRNEFETQLLAYSKFSPKGVKKGLREMCQYNYMPNLEYEILAHMLKHRFIDVALNFNFDEMLDAALKEEVSEGDFNYIFSDGNCPEYKNLLVGNRLKHPIFIKPHGTISHPNSLRFTRENLSRVPMDIKRLIKNIITSEVLTPIKGNHRFLRTNFIIIGFGMKSPILLECIKQYLNEKKYPLPPFFWFFDKKRNLDEFQLGLTKKQENLIKKNSHFFPIDETDKLSEYLKSLWGLIKRSFNHEKYKIKGIERHLLLNKIFDPQKEDILKNIPSNSQYLKEYFDDRILAELFINVLTSEGILNLNHIMEGRVGRYIDKLKTKELDGQNSKIALTDICEKLGLKHYKNFIMDAFILEYPNEFYKENFVSQLYSDLCRGLKTRKLKIDLKDEEKQQKK